MSDDEPKVEMKPWSVTGGHTEFGKSRIEIECPFCHSRVWAYLWSLAGSGKRCPGCKAVHHMYAGTVRKLQ